MEKARIAPQIISMKVYSVTLQCLFLPHYNIWKIWAIETKLGSGCGSVGRAVNSNTRGPRFDSSHGQNFNWTIIIVDCIEKTKIKKKEAWNGPLLKHPHLLGRQVVCRDGLLERLYEWLRAVGRGLRKRRSWTCFTAWRDPRCRPNASSRNPARRGRFCLLRRRRENRLRVLRWWRHNDWKAWKENFVKIPFIPMASWE